MKKSQSAKTFSMPSARPSRVIIERITPSIDGGRFPAKRYIYAPIEVEAVLLIDGHDKIQARLLYRHETSKTWQVTAMVATGNDIWSASFVPDRLGRYLFVVEAAQDRFGTWASDIQKKMLAGQTVTVDVMTGVELIQSWPQRSDSAENDLIEKTIALLRLASKQPEGVTAAAIKSHITDPSLVRLAFESFDDTSLVRLPWEVPIQVEPMLSRFSSWYEFFPRSLVEPSRDKNKKHGTFKDAEARLPYIQKMGFDIVYLPPIHPIGTAFRKGRNNTLTIEDGDVGSPWAIGSKEGGHCALHPELGTFDDFASLVKKAQSLKMEMALDIAFQCSPDHPYVKEHPEWFKKRPDGSIQYAENPPKKYQDIYPFDFETSDWKALWIELRDVVQFWVDRGIKVFRVDNPHTKALHFWEWMIRDIRSRHPEVLFLAEAFTRPHIMAYLAKAGFSQSYTYFTWRNVKWELTQYMEELTGTELVDFFQPNFWPNTPDILPEPLQAPNRAVYVQRLILAATLSSCYGIYGPAFELMEYEPVREGSEEYLNSEKYEIRQWNLNQSESLAPLIQRINEIRHAEKALQQNRTFRLLEVSNESLFAFAKSHGDEYIIVVVNLDPHNTQAGMVELPLKDWKIDPNETFQVHDLLTESRYYWSGWRNYVELNPQVLPAHIFRVRRRARGASDFEYYT